MQKLLDILKTMYGLNIDVDAQYNNVYASNQILTLIIISPHAGTKHKWMVRISTVAAFDRWANSCAIEEFFNNPEEIITYFTNNQVSIYLQLIEYLSSEYEDIYNMII